MCRTPACSHPAVSSVHQRPYSNTGIAPLAAEQEQDAVRRRQRHHLHLAARQEQREHVERDGAAHDQRHESEILPEAAQRVRIAPQSRIAPAAVVAAVVVDTDQHAAGRAEDGAFGLALQEHSTIIVPRPRRRRAHGRRSTVDGLRSRSTVHRSLSPASSLWTVDRRPSTAGISRRAARAAAVVRRRDPSRRG